MNSNQEILQNAQNLNYQFISVRANEAIHKLLDKVKLNAEDKHYLEKAGDMLESIVNGQSLVSDGKMINGVNPIQSLNAYKHATHPLTLLAKENNMRESNANFVKTMANTIKNRDLDNLENRDLDNLRMVSRFFDHLGNSLSSTISHSQNQKNRSGYELTY